jgi:hypothetical protein
MNPVVQDEPTGCGIAAVATIVEKEYFEVKDLANSLGIFAEDNKLFSDTKYVCKLLDKYNIISQPKKPFASWEALPDLALLASNYHIENGRPFWHWVVFLRENNQTMILDSNPSLDQNKRTDLDQIRAEWYIEVTKN